MLTKLRVAIVGRLTYFFVTCLVPNRVGPVMRVVFRIPLLFYHLGLSWLVPKWILILGTTGRRSGKPRYTALEYGYDPHKKRYFLMSGWGGKSDWYRNARVHPQVQLWVGTQRIAAIAKPATHAEVADEMESILKIYPNAFHTWAAHSGVPYDGTRASLLRMAEAFPSIIIYE